MRRLLEALDKSNRRHQLLQKGDRIVVGLSGGPDSTALLLLLSVLKKKYALHLFAAHLNHGIVAKNSLKFERFSKKLARRLGVPFFRKKVSLKKLAQKKHKTLEEIGRIERYHFFSETARKVRANKIATAHTLDDQAETILMYLARGAGLRGLAGIPAKRSLGKLWVIRPLIGISKKEILSHLRASGESFCLDPSNATNRFTRNRVRNKLIPWMEKHLNPQIREALSETGGICQETIDFLNKASSQALTKCLLRKKRSEIILNSPRLQALHPAVLSETLLAAITLLKGDRLRLGASHIESVRALLISSKSPLEAHLPGFLVAVKEKRCLRIFDSSAK